VKDERVEELLRLADQIADLDRQRLQLTSEIRELDRRMELIVTEEKKKSSASATKRGDRFIRTRKQGMPSSDGGCPRIRSTWS